MPRGVKPDRLSVPITPGATAETVGLYRWLLTAKQHRRYILGTSDMIWDMPETTPDGSPYIHGTEQIFKDIAGDWPGFLGFEYHDPAWVNRWGSAATDMVRAALLRAHARGSVIGLHVHCGNPVTGQMSRNGLSWRDPQTGTGNYGDRNGNPLAAIKTGGAQEAQFLAWMDRLADFINSLVDSKGKQIPVLLRPFHELGTGTWFWWNGGDRAADMILVWRKFVDYMRNVKGLTNVLYCWNVSMQASSNYFPWWPTSAYVDVISYDMYDNRNSPDVSFDGQWTQANYDFLVGYANNGARSMPLAVAELGYQYHAENSITDIWDVRTGDALSKRYPQFGLNAIWDRPWGPQQSNTQALKASFKRWTDSPNALTASKLGGIYSSHL